MFQHIAHSQMQITSLRGNHLMTGYKLAASLLLALSTISASTLIYAEASTAKPKVSEAEAREAKSKALGRAVTVLSEESLEGVTVIARVEGDFVTIPGNSSSSFTLACPQDFDREVISGGIDSQSTTGRGFLIQDSFPIFREAWFFRLRNDSSSSQTVRPFVVCGN